MQGHMAVALENRVNNVDRNSNRCEEKKNFIEIISVLRQIGQKSKPQTSL